MCNLKQDARETRIDNEKHAYFLQYLHFTVISLFVQQLRILRVSDKDEEIKNNLILLLILNER